MTNFSAFLRFLIITFFISAVTFSMKGTWAEEGGEQDSWLPVETVEYGKMNGRAFVGGPPFQTCDKCSCCQQGDPSTVCLTVPCCYRIDCHVPGKPGVCSFKPFQCNCSSCGRTDQGSPSI